MSAYGLGLGLGMTSIAAAVARGSAVDVVPSGGDAASMAAPAVAYATTGGRIATGADARRRAIGSPDRLVSRVLHDVARGSSMSAGDPGDEGIATTSWADDPVRALRAMVQGVITAVAAGQGGDPARLTVTHPTPWSAEQVAALADAVRPVVPGSGALQLIPNAVAVAVDYTVDHPLADGEAVGVVDVGATCFEAAVVGRRGTELVLLSPRVAHGVTGGDQFDDAVLQLVDRAAGGAVTALHEATTLQAQIARDRLRRDCRLAKEALSTDKAATITAATLTAYLPTGTVTVRLTRAAFDDAIRARAEGLVETISRALGGVRAAAGLRAVVLTGGCTQIPLLQRLLGRAASGPLVVARFAAARSAAILAAPRSAAPTTGATSCPPRAPGPPRPAPGADRSPSTRRAAPRPSADSTARRPPATVSSPREARAGPLRRSGVLRLECLGGDAHVPHRGGQPAMPE